MSDTKLQLAKKKAQLAELQKRKQARELERRARVENSTQTSTFLYKNGMPASDSAFDIIQTLPNGNGHKPVSYQSASASSEFENLNAQEILEKCGLLKASNNTLSTSSFSISHSSSSRSSTPAAGFINGFIHSFNQKSFVDDFDEGSMDCEESITKRIEHLSITSDICASKINIYPNEVITYNKETQTRNSYDFPDEGNTEMLGEEFSGDTKQRGDPEQSSRKKKRAKHREVNKPLAYYDDIFIYDTFEWEDEVAEDDVNSSEGFDIAKELNLDALTFMDAQLNLNDNYLLHDTNKLIKGIQNLGSDDEELVNDVSGLNFTENFLQSPKQKFIHTEEKLGRFLREKRPIIERALAQNAKNIFFDYSVALNENSNEESNDSVINIKQTFSSTSNSVVTCLDWSLQYSELLLCAYENMTFNYEEAASESVAAIWNARNGQKSPQQTLTCTSLITSCCFASFNSNLIIGGTYSGQIVMWDIRCSKPTPIQRSALSVAAHTNPVYCVKVIDNRDSSQLVSISNDGKLCTWSLENLNLPVDTTELYIASTNRNVYATCFDFQTIVNDNIEAELNNSNNNVSRQINESYSYVYKANLQMFKQFAIVGAEDGLVHSVSKNTSKFSLFETFNSHESFNGPVTAVSCYNQCKPEYNEYSYQTNEYLSQLFLTSSFDGSIKLWNSTDNSGPIHSFECNGEYVYDVCWSPIHPALFASVDGSGKLDLWHLNKDTELPSASIVIDNGVRALNKLKWSRKGTEIAVGDDHGHISIFEISDSFIRPESEETRKLLSTVDDLRQMNFDYGKLSSMNYSNDVYR